MPTFLIKLISISLLIGSCQADEFQTRGDSVDAMLKTAVEDGRITAGIAMLARDSEVLWLKTAGEMQSGIPMRDDAILPLASVGKMFTATALMILFEDGIVSLDDPVSKYIPEFADAKVAVETTERETVLVPVEQPITIFHLLTHTSGLMVTGDEFWSVWDAHVRKTTTTHFARDLVKLPLFAQPGSAFRYGQTGAAYEALAAVMEIASGETLENLMQVNIFDPLGLKDSSFYLPPEKSARLPAIYRKVDGELVMERAAGEDFSRTTFLHGGGGVRSAPGDILKFARLFINGGAVDGVRILEPASIAMMMSDQLGDKAPEPWQQHGLSWGFGGAVTLLKEPNQETELTQYGWVGGGFAQLFVDPRENLVAYIGFPLTPPGDNALLREFEAQVYSRSE